MNSSEIIIAPYLPVNSLVSSGGFFEPDEEDKYDLSDLVDDEWMS